MRRERAPLCPLLQEDQILVTQLLEVMHNAGMYRERALAILAVVRAHVEAIPQLALL